MQPVSLSLIRYIQSLQQKKFRLQHRAFVVEGEKMLNELLATGYSIQYLCALSSWYENHQEIAGRVHACYQVNTRELGRISSLRQPNQVLAVVHMPEESSSVPAPESGLQLALESIQDPGNLGTIIRTADWFGLQQIFCSKDTAELYNPKVIQATMGSFARVKVIYTDLPKLVKETQKHMRVYAAMLAGTPLPRLKINRNAMLLIGNESRGLSAELHKLADICYAIPGKGGAESLNASVASGISLAWFHAEQSSSPDV